MTRGYCIRQGNTNPLAEEELQLPTLNNVGETMGARSWQLQPIQLRADGKRKPPTGP